MPIPQSAFNEVIRSKVQKTAGEVKAVAADSSRSPSWKQNEAARLIKTAKENLEAAFAERQADLESEREELLPKSAMPVPDGDDAARLNYVLAAVTAKSRRQTLADFVSDWKTAITIGNAISLRVYYDFGESLLADLKGGNESRFAANGKMISELQTATEEKLLPYNVKAARKRLAEIEAETKKSPIDLGNALRDLAYQTGELQANYRM